MPTDENAVRARGVLKVKKTEKTVLTVSILASNLFIDRQHPFYLSLGILIIKKPKLAVFLN